MGNKLSCSCAPLIRKAYRYEDTPWQNTRRRDGHLLRLWAEVFHVSASSGAVKWQQVSEDLVPVNITCIQDTPECVFHITAYNSQVEKILDVRLVQPGTRLGQASECFVYWKDVATGDTWGLNFTSPIDAKQFRECCSPTFKFSRKASSSYSLKLEPPKQQKVKGKRKPQSTPSSPSRGRELQCTCMTAENLHRTRNGRVRYTGAATLPRTQTRSADDYKGTYDGRGRLSAHPSSTSVYDNVGGTAARKGTTTVSVHNQNKMGKPGDQGRNQCFESNRTHANRSEQARAQYAQSARKEQAKSMDYSMMPRKQTTPTPAEIQPQIRSKSKSSDNVFEQAQSAATKTNSPGATHSSTEGNNNNEMGGLSLDSNTLKRMLHPLPSTSSTHSSPEQDSQLQQQQQQQHHHQPPPQQQIRERRKSDGEESARERRVIVPIQRATSASSAGGIRSRQNRSETGRRRSLERSLCLDLTDADRSPPSDNFLYDNLCYATTPSSSNENSDAPYVSSDEGGIQHGIRRTPASPTNKLLVEYETHLRNALARGLDAESYSLHTFEALLSQSMENVVALMREVHVELEAIKKEESAMKSQRFVDGRREIIYDQRTGLSSKSSTLPFSSRHLSLSTSIGSSGSMSLGDNLNPAFAQQTSIDSTDSRIYLTSSEMSDDDRLSLTTAVSDEEDGESRNSPYRSRSGAAAASFNCTGAVRKAGFLSVKKWLLRKHQQVELARKRGWKGYWVCLKGTTLLFYPCDNRDGRAIDSAPKHLIIVDGAIMQPIPEHPKRDYIFCLSTAFGDAYLFQAPCQVELENWINSIHSACAAAFARHRGKTGTLHLLQEEIFRLEKEIESDFKLKHMAELQLTVVADSDSKQSLTNQINQWEENLERLHCEQFRLRCYMASLQNAELPNPKSLLTHVSKVTKSTLNKLGVFTVSSFHAYVCARSPSLLTNLLSGRGATKRRTRAILSRSNSSKRSLSLSTTSSQSIELPMPGEKQVIVQLPENQSAVVGVRDNMTVEELVWSACGKKQLSPQDHFLRIKRKKDNEEYCLVPPRNEILDNLAYETLEVCAKVLYQVELARSTLEQLFGFSVEAELVENVDHQDELCVYVSRVEENSLAHRQGLMKADEIMVINGAIVSDLDMMYIESVLQEEQSLCMMMRSARTEPPDLASVMKTTDDYIESLVCPPPPSDSALSEEMIGKLIVPSPLWGSQEKSPETSGRPTPSPVPSQEGYGILSSEQIETLLKFCDLSGSTVQQVNRDLKEVAHKTMDQVSEYCRVMPDRRQQNISVAAPGRQLSDGEKLRKVIMELVETERTYVKHMSDLLEWYVDSLKKHLNNLLEHYLEPMKKETFLSNAEINSLFGNIQEIVQFQRVFLQSLEEAISAEPDFLKFDHPTQFRNVLFALGNSFLYYADQFKLYSSFCASHSKAQKVLHPSEGNAALAEFLQSRNPKGQHSFSLESYLIKPIQRILKYPLLLQQLKHLTDPATQENQHLAEALKGMERVAEHINEMQRIHEEYGAIFDHLFRQHLKSSKQHVDLSPGELLYYGGVEWINISEFLGKIKKGLELHAMCFVFKTAVVFLCKERIRQKKKLMVRKEYKTGGSSKNNTSEVEIIRYQVLIPVTEVQVRASSIKDADLHFLWELIHLKSQIQRRSEKVYQLSNSTSEFRNAFLRTIRQIIRESVRNMTVPANKQITREKVSQSKKNYDSQGVARTLSSKKKSKTPQRHSAGNIDSDYSVETYDNVDQNFRTRSKTVADGMDDMGGSSKDLSESRGQSPSHVDSERSDKSDKSDKSDRSEKSNKSDKSNHSHTSSAKPNHHLSTTSTLSSSSTGSSSAKLIQSSNPPASYQPQAAADSAGSPVWKPRDGSTERPIAAKGKEEQYFVYDEYGVYVTPSSAQKKDHVATMSSKQSDC